MVGFPKDGHIYHFPGEDIEMEQFSECRTVCINFIWELSGQHIFQSPNVIRSDIICGHRSTMYTGAVIPVIIMHASHLPDMLVIKACSHISTI